MRGKKPGARKQGADVGSPSHDWPIQRISRQSQRRHGRERKHRPVHPYDAAKTRCLGNLTSAHGAHDKGSRRPTAHPPVLEPPWRSTLITPPCDALVPQRSSHLLQAPEMASAPDLDVAALG
jgi:hypothetical protein